LTGCDSTSSLFGIGKKALTGCDSTSSLFGIVKKAACQALSKKVTTGNALAGLRNANVLESWMEAAIELVLAMYGNRA